MVKIILRQNLDWYQYILKQYIIVMGSNILTNITDIYQDTDWHTIKKSPFFTSK